MTYDMQKPQRLSDWNLRGLKQSQMDAAWNKARTIICFLKLSQRTRPIQLEFISFEAKQLVAAWNKAKAKYSTWNRSGSTNGWEEVKCSQSDSPYELKSGAKSMIWKANRLCCVLADLAADFFSHGLRAKLVTWECIDWVLVLQTGCVHGSRLTLCTLNELHLCVTKNRWITINNFPN